MPFKGLHERKEGQSFCPKKKKKNGNCVAWFTRRWERGGQIFESKGEEGGAKIWAPAGFAFQSLKWETRKKKNGDQRKKRKQWVRPTEAFSTLLFLTHCNVWGKERPKIHPWKQKGESEIRALAGYASLSKICTRKGDIWKREGGLRPKEGNRGKNCSRECNKEEQWLLRRA